MENYLILQYILVALIVLFAVYSLYKIVKKDSKIVKKLIKEGWIDDVDDIYNWYSDNTSNFFEINLKWTLNEEKDCVKDRINW